MLSKQSSCAAVICTVAVLFLTVAAVPISANSATDPTAELVQTIDKLDQETSLPLFGGLSVERMANAAAAPRSGSETLLERAERYMQTHQVQFNVPQNEENDGHIAEARSSKVKKILLPLLLALKLKMALILPIVLKAITFISLKGLAVGTIALLISGATFVKDLLAKKQEHITTAYISGAGATPVNAEFVHHHGNEWNRNAQVGGAQDLAYNYHTLPQYV